MRTISPVRPLPIAAFFIAVFALCCPLRATESTPDFKDIPGLINALADPDSAQRQRAAEALADLGAAARPDLIHAARGDNPEIRAQAARVLRKLPWSASDDPVEAQRALDAYGEADDRNRIGITRKLDEIGAHKTLLRLFNEEPSD